MAAVYNTRTIVQEVRSALNWPDSDQMLTDEEIYSRMIGRMETEQSWVFRKLMTNIYKVDLGDCYQIHGISFTGEETCTYEVDPKGTIRISNGTATATSITATGCLVYFNGLMVDILKWLATHRSIEAGINVPMGSYTPRTASEILDMASVWEGITNG